ncbi:MAG: hypothetical protein HKN68_01280 [Saprospiraceae bacterium]|nr:hypothetical protein [Saprospiraceae bacterium]
MESNSFDDIIKSKLKELENQPTTSDWDLFEEKYDHELSGGETTLDGAVALGAESFDDIIKSKLIELENQSVDSDWEQFESMYDQELTGDDAIFDRSIADKVDNFNVAFNSQHWVIMKERLEREEFIRTSVYFSKIAEAAIVFLLLFTFLNIFPALQYEYQPSSSAFAEKSESTKNTEEINIINASSDVNTTPSIIREAQTEKIRFNRISNAISREARSFIEIEKIPIKKKPGFAALENKSIIPSPISEQSYLSELTTLDGRNGMIENEKMEIYRARVKPRELNGPKGESMISLAFSPTVNIVNSPANYILNTQPYTVDALGIEAGIGYSFRKNGFEIGTGLTYARKAYNPQIQNQYTGRFSEGYAVETLKNIEFDLVSVPLFLNYSLASGDDFNLYAGVGSSINIITSAGYKVRENGEEFDALSRYQDTGRSASREYTQGILQGGSIHDNLFISLDISIGLETNLSENLSIFFAPTLRQHIGIAGIGPNKDHVHSLGLNLGLKKKI